MNIAVIGTGRIGRALGAGWAARGHRVTFGSRRPDDPEIRALVERFEATVATPDEAARVAEVVVLATPWQAAEEAVRGLGELGNRVLVDATNPIGAGWTLLGPPSGGEQVAGWASGGHVVKAFNTTGFENMADADYGDARLAMLLAGDDTDAKATVGRLADDLGFEPVDAGPLARAAWLEALALVWITQSLRPEVGRAFGFAVLRR